MKRLDKELTAKELATLSDDEIDFSDIPELDESFWEHAKVFAPKEKTAMSLRVHSDVLEYFQDDGPGYQTRMHAVLKAYVVSMLSRANTSSSVDNKPDR